MRSSRLFLLLPLASVDALVVQHVSTVIMAPTSASARAGITCMNFFEKLMKGLDDFADDAVGRRLGNGAKFYGKRKSSCECHGPSPFPYPAHPLLLRVWRTDRCVCGGLRSLWRR